MDFLSFSGDRGGNHEARVRRQGLRETPEEEAAGTQPLREGEEAAMSVPEGGFIVVGQIQSFPSHHS